MTNEEKARETANRLRRQTEEEKYKQIVTKEDMELEIATRKGLGIEGLEDFDTSTLPVPFVKLVQPGSTGILLKDNKTEAPVGSYYFGDIKEFRDPLNFVLLKAKHGKKTFPDKKTGKMVTSPALAILGLLPLDDKMFLLSLRVSSFSSFGQFAAQLKQQKLITTWQRIVSATSHRLEKNGNKYQVADFSIDAEVPVEDQGKYASLASMYGEVVNKAFDADEDGIITTIAEASFADDTDVGSVVNAPDQVDENGMPF